MKREDGDFSTIETAQGPVTARMQRAGGVLQLNVHHLPGKRFGLFAVYDEADLGRFENALRGFVEGDGLQAAEPDKNITDLMDGCIAAGTGPVRTMKIEFGKPGISHAQA